MTNIMCRSRRRSAAGVGALAAAMLALSGCAAEPVESEETTVPVSTTEAPTATPMFASDEEALEAGVAALEAAAATEIAHSGRAGDPTSHFEEVAEGQFLQDLLDGHQRNLGQRVTFDGAYSFDEAQLWRVAGSGDEADMTFSVCFDPRHVTRVSGGNPPSSQPAGDARAQLEVAVHVTDDGAKVTRNELWTPNGCV